jgi:hypothetical protein
LLAVIPLRLRKLLEKAGAHTERLTEMMLDGYEFTIRATGSFAPYGIDFHGYKRWDTVVTALENLKKAWAKSVEIEIKTSPNCLTIDVTFKPVVAANCV